MKPKKRNPPFPKGKTRQEQKTKKTLIEKFLLGGTPNTQIIQQLNSSKATVTQTKQKLKRQGIQIPKYKKTKWKTEKGQTTTEAKIRKLLLKGMAQTQIVKQTGIKKTWISRIKRTMEKEGFTIPKQ